MIPRAYWFKCIFVSIFDLINWAILHDYPSVRVRCQLMGEAHSDVRVIHPFASHSFHETGRLSYEVDGSVKLPRSSTGAMEGLPWAH